MNLFVYNSIFLYILDYFLVSSLRMSGSNGMKLLMLLIYIAKLFFK